MKKLLLISALIMYGVNSYGVDAYTSLRICDNYTGNNSKNMPSDRKKQLAISDACEKAGMLYKCGDHKLNIQVNRDRANNYFGLAREINGAPGLYGDTPCSNLSDSATPQPSQKITSTAFVKQYFRQLKKVPYEQTWNMLANSMKQQTTFSSHVKWWDRQVDRIELLNATSLNRNTVQALLKYYLKNGKIVCSRDTFSLNRNADSWLIASQKSRTVSCR